MVNYLLHSPGKYADVVELVDSLDLGDVTSVKFFRRICYGES